MDPTIVQERRQEERRQLPIRPRIPPTPPARARGRKIRSGDIHRTLRASMWDGLFSATTTGLVDSYLVPYALALRATAAQISNLVSIPNLVTALAQSQASVLRGWLGGRRSALLFIVMAQVISLLLLPLLSWVPPAARNAGLLLVV